MESGEKACRRRAQFDRNIGQFNSWYNLLIGRPELTREMGEISWFIWKDYPHLHDRSRQMCDEFCPEAFPDHRRALNAAHSVAVDILMRLAIKFELDPKPLHRAGVLIQTLPKNDPEIFYHPENNADERTWPECLAVRILELPEEHQRILREGDSLFAEIQIRHRYQDSATEEDDTGPDIFVWVTDPDKEPYLISEAEYDQRMHKLKMEGMPETTVLETSSKGRQTRPPWIHGRAESPPPEFCTQADPNRPCGPVIGNRTELGYSTGHSGDDVTERQLRKVLESAATDAPPCIWVKEATQGKETPLETKTPRRDLEGYFHSQKERHEAEKRLQEYRQRNRTEPNGTERN